MDGTGALINLLICLFNEGSKNIQTPGRRVRIKNAIKQPSTLWPMQPRALMEPAQNSIA